MATLTKKLTQVLYVGATPLTLGNLPANVKSAVKLVRQTNPGGTGYASFNPALNVNSLTGISAKTDAAVAQLIVETVASTAISVDLGPDWAFGIATPTGSAPPAPDTYTLDGQTVVAGETVFDAGDQQLTVTQAGSLTAAFASGSGTVQVSFNGGTSWTSVATTPVAVAVGQVFVFQVLHAADQPFLASLTFTYA